MQFRIPLQKQFVIRDQRLKVFGLKFDAELHTVQRERASELFDLRFHLPSYLFTLASFALAWLTLS